MRARSASSLVAALVLLSPLAVAAAPACAPGQHCLMGAAMSANPPCHGTAIQADNCCLTAATTEPAEAVSVIAATVFPIDDGAPAPWLGPGERVSPATCDNASSRPLYHLFRALLI